MAVVIEPPNDDRVDVLAGRLDVLAGEVAVLAVRVDECFKRVDERFERIDERFEQVDRELLEQRREIKAGFEKLNDRLTYALVAVIGAGATIATAVLAAPHL